MNRRNDISHIFQSLTSRYDRISISTIKGILSGVVKVEHTRMEFVSDKNTPPCIDEAQRAFQTHNCAILTAFRGGYTIEENMQRNERLKADMIDVGLDYRPVKGCYREADWEYANIEYCFFIFDEINKSGEEFFSKVYMLSEKYEQDSFLYKRAGINRSAFLVATNDAARTEFKSDIKYAGQLFLHVPDVEAWTDCSDGRIAFQLKGMVLIGTGNKKIKIGEGNLFDAEGYDADCIVVIGKKSQEDLVAGYKAVKNGKVPFFKHFFEKEEQTEEAIHDAIMQCLKKARDKKCKRIGFHCSATVNGSSVEAARIAFDTVQTYAKRYTRKLLEWIVLVDIYGDYSKL